MEFRTNQMKTPDEIKNQLVSEWMLRHDISIQTIIDKAFSLGVEEGKKLNNLNLEGDKGGSQQTGVSAKWKHPNTTSDASQIVALASKPSNDYNKACEDIINKLKYHLPRFTIMYGSTKITVKRFLEEIEICKLQEDKQ